MDKTQTNFSFKIHIGNNTSVKKFVFTKKDAIAESVVYMYGSYFDRTVICCSVQSGCPVGCTFCGTGKKFIRNLTADEIVDQVQTVISHENISTIACKKFQIMFMSMGEPMLNWTNLKLAIEILNNNFPNADLLISTVGINKEHILSDIIEYSKKYKKIGLQFSIHRAFEDERNKIIPYLNKMSLMDIRDYGIMWFHNTNRNPFINYCITEHSSSDLEINILKMLFPKSVFKFTFSVICNADKDKQKDDTDYKSLDRIYKSFLDDGYDVRVFDPAGKDDIGGGCGQLWFVQEWMKKYRIKN